MRYHSTSQQVPSWLSTHLLEYQRLEDVSDDIWDDLRQGLARFQSSKPKVSIVIPVYNEEKSLLRTLSSISQLRLPEVYPTELLLINDGSVDRTQDLIKLLDIPHIYLASKQKQQISRTIGLHQSKGEYVLHANAGTFYGPDWGLDFVSYLSDPHTVMVMGTHVFLPEGEHKVGLAFPGQDLKDKISYRFGFSLQSLYNQNGFNSGIKREAALEHGRYTPDSFCSSDGKMAYMLKKVGRVQWIHTEGSCVWTHKKMARHVGSPLSILDIPRTEDDEELKLSYE
ncbi:MAG: glycosyltransferase family 2 protein [Bacteroidota bacterium]